MHSLLERLTSAAIILMPVWADAAIKSIFVLAATWAAAAALRRGSAAARHLVWVLGMASLLVIPVFSAALPGWHVLPAWAPPRSAESAIPPGAPAAAAQAPMEHAVPMISQLPASPSNSLPPLVTARAAHISWQAMVLLAWAAGAMLLLGRLALGLASLRWLEHRSDYLTDETWVALLRDLSSRSGFRRRIGLLSSPHRDMPMVWGVWRIRVLLPACATGWTTDQRRSVLLHELAHVRRNDCLTQLLAQVVRAVYWFNPLAWLACQRLEVEREAACDDLVLGNDIRPSDYAAQLLHIAAEFRSGRGQSAAIAMARASRLENRLRGVLDARQNRKTVTTTAAAAASIAALLVAGGIAVLGCKQSAPASSSANAAASSAAPAIPASAPSADLRFGPTIERTLEIPISPSQDEEWFNASPGNDPVPGKRFLNLATGEVFSLPKNATGADSRSWLLDHGIEIVANRISDVQGEPLVPALQSFSDRVLFAETPCDWDSVQPADFDGLWPKTSSGQSAQLISSNLEVRDWSQLPQAFLFKTRGGLKGVLQIVKIVGDPEAMQIRYKVIEPATATQPAADGSPAFSPEDIQRLKHLREEMASARLAQIEAEANYDAAWQCKSDPEKLRHMAGPALVAKLDPIGETLRGQLGDLKLQVDLLGRKGYGPKSPLMEQDLAITDELQDQVGKSDSNFATAYLDSLLQEKKDAEYLVRRTSDTLNAALTRGK